MPVIPFESDSPKVDPTVFVAPGAWVIGRTEIAKDASIFFGAVLRGDINKIIVGERSNIQDNAILHTSRGLGDCIVLNEVTIGHGAILHGCTVKDRCIIGMGATILDEAVIGEDCIVGANSLVTMRTIIPPRSLVMGSPAKVVRTLKDDEFDSLRGSAESYYKKSRWYLEYFRTHPHRSV